MNDKEIPPEITTKDGLLYRNGKVIDLPEADLVAIKYGYVYAELLVDALKKRLAINSLIK